MTHIQHFFYYGVYHIEITNKILKTINVFRL